MARDASGKAVPRGVRGERPGERPDDHRNTGARAAGGGGEEKKKRGGLVGLLLALLALLVIIALLFLLLGGKDDKKSGSGGSSSNSGSLTAGGKALLPVPSSGLSSFEGKQAKGTALKVVTTNGNQGFSVAKGGGKPVYIEWGGDVGRNESSSFQPKKGQKVNLTGPVEAAGADAVKRLKLDAAEAKLVRSQGAFVNADRVVQSK